MNGEAPFGFWLEKSREVLALTQEDLAHRAGCSAATVRKIEAGDRRPSPQVAARLADCCGLAGTERVAFLRYARGDRPSLLPSLPPHTAAAAPWRRPRMEAVPLPVPPNHLSVVSGR